MEKNDQYWVRGKCIGRGSFGTVTLAFDRSDGTTFAVKSVVLNQPKLLLDSLENEIDILRSLDSNYVVSYLGNSTDGGFRNLHMEYMPAGTLADVAGKIDELRIRSYTRCVVEALFYLHSVAGVVHSDVKGRNVLLGATPGLAKLSDFGSAARINVPSDNTKTPIGGTPLWMAPEVMRGERATPESDVWSLGCTVIEMASGFHPWRNSDRSSSSSATDQLFRIGYGDELPQLSSGLSKLGLDFLGKCLRRRPEERWTAEQLLQHPFLAVAVGTAAGIGESPRSTLAWVNFSDFDDEDDDDDEQSCHGDVMELGRERIRELGMFNNGGIVNWDGDQGWEVIRSFEQEAEDCYHELGNLGDQDVEIIHRSTSIITVPADNKESDDKMRLQIGRAAQQNSSDTIRILPIRRYHVGYLMTTVG